MYLTSSGLDLDLEQPTKERKLHEKPYISCIFALDRLFLDTIVGISQSNVTRLRRDEPLREGASTLFLARIPPLSENTPPCYRQI